MSDATVQPIRCTFPIREMPTMNSFSKHLLTRTPTIIHAEEDWFNIAYQHATTTNKIAGSIDTFIDIKKLNRKIIVGKYKKDRNKSDDVRRRFGISAIPLYTKLDSFFIILWGSIASLTNEIMFVYSLDINEHRAYVFNVINELTRDRSLKNSSLTSYLLKQREEWWFNYLNKIRNRIEHGLIFPLCVEGKEIILPDNPKAEAQDISFNEKLELVMTCKTLLDRTADLLESAYKEMDKFLFG